MYCQIPSPGWLATWLITQKLCWCDSSGGKMLLESCWCSARVTAERMPRCLVKVPGCCAFHLDICENKRRRPSRCPMISCSQSQLFNMGMHGDIQYELEGWLTNHRLVVDNSRACLHTHKIMDSCDVASLDVRRFGSFLMAPLGILGLRPRIYIPLMGLVCVEYVFWISHIFPSIPPDIPYKSTNPMLSLLKPRIPTPKDAWAQGENELNEARQCGHPVVDRGVKSFFFLCTTCMKHVSSVQKCYEDCF